MLAQQQPQSRWTAFVERWDGRLERFRLSIDPFAEGPERRMKPWAIAALSVGLVVFAALIGFGGWWIARTALAPVSDVAEAAEQITAQRLDARLNEPPVTSPLTLNSLPGSRVTMEIAPPMELRPNKVPCGPFKISTRSTSSMVVLAPTLRAR